MVLKTILNCQNYADTTDQLVAGDAIPGAIGGKSALVCHGGAGESSSRAFRLLCPVGRAPFLLIQGSFVDSSVPFVRKSALV